MRGIKIPQQDFALKRQGGLMREGVVGRICGDTTVTHSSNLKFNLSHVQL